MVEHPGSIQGASWEHLGRILGASFAQKCCVTIQKHSLYAPTLGIKSYYNHWPHPSYCLQKSAFSWCINPNCWQQIYSSFHVLKFNADRYIPGCHHPTVGVFRISIFRTAQDCCRSKTTNSWEQSVMLVNMSQQLGSI